MDNFNVLEHLLFFDREQCLLIAISVQNKTLHGLAFGKDIGHAHFGRLECRFPDYVWRLSDHNEPPLAVDAHGAADNHEDKCGLISLLENLLAFDEDSGLGLLDYLKKMSGLSEFGKHLVILLDILLYKQFFLVSQFAQRLAKEIKHVLSQVAVIPYVLQNLALEFRVIHKVHAFVRPGAFPILNLEFLPTLHDGFYHRGRVVLARVEELFVNWRHLPFYNHFLPLQFFFILPMVLNQWIHYPLVILCQALGFQASFDYSTSHNLLRCLFFDKRD